jgi:hypothetical protein
MKVVVLFIVSTLLTASISGAQPAPEGEASPFSLDRIRRQLDDAPRVANAEGLRLRYYLDVYGRMPPLDLFKDFDLEVGPLAYGSPTHNEILDVVTPREFRAPVANLSNVVQAITDWLAKRAAEKKARSQQ